MKYEFLGKSNIKASRVALGLMRIADKTDEEAVEIVKTALDNGINFFDHADIYGAGNSEIKFSKAIETLKVDRKDIYIQSKVGIEELGKSYNFSKEHIINSVDGILKRLNTTYLDSLLLHRPDILWEPEEIKEAFDILYKSGKVKHFGVSNMNQFQISYLKSVLPYPIIANQLQFSIMHANMVSTGVYVNSNLKEDGFDSVGILDYLREHNITVQAWSPFQYGRYEGVFVDNDKFKELNEVLDKIAKKYNTTKTTITVSWILTHPANIQVLIGTMTPSRIIECANATNIKLERDEWYEIYRAGGNSII